MTTDGFTRTLALLSDHYCVVTVPPSLSTGSGTGSRGSRAARAFRGGSPVVGAQSPHGRRARGWPVAPAERVSAATPTSDERCEVGSHESRHLPAAPALVVLGGGRPLSGPAPTSTRRSRYRRRARTCRPSPPPTRLPQVSIVLRDPRQPRASFPQCRAAAGAQVHKAAEALVEAGAAGLAEAEGSQASPGDEARSGELKRDSETGMFLRCNAFESRCACEHFEAPRNRPSTTSYRASPMKNNNHQTGLVEKGNETQSSKIQKNKISIEKPEPAARAIRSSSARPHSGNRKQKSNRCTTPDVQNNESHNLA